MLQGQSGVEREVTGAVKALFYPDWIPSCIDIIVSIVSEQDKIGLGFFDRFKIVSLGQLGTPYIRILEMSGRQVFDINPVFRSVEEDAEWIEALNVAVAGTAQGFEE